jgi:hypothetical protein
MRIQAQAGVRVGFGPAGEPALREPFLTNPKPLPVVSQTLDGVAAARAENKERAAERVAGQYLTTKSRQTIDAFTKIDGLDGQQNPHLGSNLNHRRWCQKASASGRRSRELAAGKWIAIFAPVRCVNSTRHSGRPFEDGATANSTKAGKATGALLGNAVFSRFLSR